MAEENMAILLKMIQDDYDNTVKQIILLKYLRDNCELENNIAVILLFHRKSHVRMDNFFERWIDRYLDEDFYSLFRMNRKTFYCLFNQINCPELNKKYAGGFEQVPAEKQLLLTLWWLGKGEALISISEKFNIAISTVFSCTMFVLQKIIDLLETYIVWPEHSEMRQVENEFRLRSGFPGIIGAIDVCNIPFKAPAANQEDYIDRKQQHSIKLQAVCTTNKIFTNIFVGFPRSAHDSRVFRNSSLYLNVEEYNNMHSYFLNNEYHIVGDSAYPLSNWVMTPYRDNGHLNPIQRKYNTCHSISRIVIEHSFGLLKSRWRILKYVNVNSIEKAVQIITACCILHNFCYVNSDIWEQFEPYNDEVPEVGLDVRQQNIYSEAKRNNIAQLL